jgi:TPR repeat protein
LEKKMRRHHIQLRAAARQGDVAAKKEMARKHLLGIDGFARHPPTGLVYLADVAAVDHAGAARLIAECMRLEEILCYGQVEMLRDAAISSHVAQVKLGAWLLVTGDRNEGFAQFEKAAAGGHSNAAAVLQACKNAKPEDMLHAVLQRLAVLESLNAPAIALAAARTALANKELGRMTLALGAALALNPKIDDEACDLVLGAARLAEAQGQQLADLGVEQVQACLEQRSAQSDPEAWFMLGRALSGIACGPLAPQCLVKSPNLRKGTALLVRAADSGQCEAWQHLYRLNSDYRCSVANPQLARFYLEKAAAGGNPEAQRRLGALMMRESASLTESERAIGWLFQASTQGDAHAKTLLASLVLRLEGCDEDALAAISELQKSDPWLATRLRISRQFGLTKLEALTVDPVEGLRPWGLVVGQNLFISQVRLSAPRAIPAVSAAALSDLRNAAAFFGSQHKDSASIEGGLRRRSASQRRTFERFDLDETMFFASASSSVRDSIRIGTRWAHHSRETLQLALAG